MEIKSANYQLWQNKTAFSVHLKVHMLFPFYIHLFLLYFWNNDLLFSPDSLIGNDQEVKYESRSYRAVKYETAQAAPGVNSYN